MNPGHNNSMKGFLNPNWFRRLFLPATVAALAFVGTRFAGEAAEKPPGAKLIGKPLAIKFTAVDGRPVDLEKLRGKVVLIDFWATWCGPCVQEVPHVKATYEKLHDKGFEIVGVSFDEKKPALQNFVSAQKIAWPQYFDGKGWDNRFGTRFGIESIPTMWLVDKKGLLRDVDARDGLEAKAVKLLSE